MGTQNSWKISGVKSTVWWQKQDAYAGLKLWRQVQHPGKLVFWLKSYRVGEILGMYGLQRSELGMWGRKSCSRQSKEAFLIFLSFLPLITSLVATQAVPPSSLSWSHFSLLTLTAITLTEPQLSLTKSTRLPPPTSFCEALLLISQFLEF